MNLQTASRWNIKAGIIILFAFSVGLSGCLGPATINKWVDKQYGDVSTVPSKAKEDFLTVTSPLATSDLKNSVTKKEVKNFLPLVIYWRYDYRNTCTLNPNIPITAFRTAALAYAKSKGLRQKLAGQKIQLSVEKLPHQFVLNDRAQMIFPIISWEILSFRPQAEDLVVNYSVTSATGQSKTGTITVGNTDKGRNVKLFQPVKKATFLYFDQYNAAIKEMSQKVMEQLVTEIQGAVAKS
jgi:hypothetical protein